MSNIEYYDMIYYDIQYAAERTNTLRGKVFAIQLPLWDSAVYHVTNHQPSSK